MSRNENDGKIKIIIIDDEKEFVETIKTFLESRNCSVNFAYGGHSGLELIKSDRPDVVILDIGMFDMDGRDVLVKLKEDVETKFIPVIILSGRGGQFDKEYGLELGAQEYMDKPYDGRVLMEKINKLIRKE